MVEEKKNLESGNNKDLEVFPVLSEKTATEHLPSTLLNVTSKRGFVSWRSKDNIPRKVQIAWKKIHIGGSDLTQRDPEP